MKKSQTALLYSSKQHLLMSYSCRPIYWHWAVLPKSVKAVSDWPSGKQLQSKHIIAKRNLERKSFRTIIYFTMPNKGAFVVFANSLQKNSTLNLLHKNTPLSLLLELRSIIALILVNHLYFSSSKSVMEYFLVDCLFQINDLKNKSMRFSFTFL